MHRFKTALWMSLEALVLVSATGCQFGDALIDGAYGGVSDTVAAVISGVLLGALGLS